MFWETSAISHHTRIVGHRCFHYIMNANNRFETKILVRVCPLNLCIVSTTSIHAASLAARQAIAFHRGGRSFPAYPLRSRIFGRGLLIPLATILGKAPVP